MRANVIPFEGVDYQERTLPAFKVFSLIAIFGLYASLIGPLQFALPVPISAVVLALLASISITIFGKIKSLGMVLFFLAIVLSGLVAALLHERTGTIEAGIFGRVCNIIAITIIAATMTGPLARRCLCDFHRINTWMLTIGLLAYVAMFATGIDFFKWTRAEFHGAQASLFRLRHTFIFSEPAYLASVVAIHIAILAVLKGGLDKLRAAMLALFATTLFLTFSFSGMITLVAFLGLLFVGKRLGNGWRIALLLGVAGLIYATISVGYLSGRLDRIATGALLDPRVMEFMRGFDAYKCGNTSAFLFGHGTGSYGIVANPCYIHVSHQTSNNTFADLLFENGLVTICGVLFVLVLFARRSGIAAVMLLVTASLYKIELFGIGAIYYASIYQAGRPKAFLSSNNLLEKIDAGKLG